MFPDSGAKAKENGQEFATKKKEYGRDGTICREVSAVYGADCANPMPSAATWLEIITLFNLAYRSNFSHSLNFLVVSDTIIKSIFQIPSAILI
jgi:hypothetical protein